MPISLNQFSPGVLTAAQLNAIVDAVTAKFNGQITTGDMLWPLRAGGNIDLAQYDLLHVVKFWSTYNLAQRASGATLQSVLTTVNSAGGGVVLLPAGSTETIGSDGVTIGAKTIFLGEGESSVLATTTGALTASPMRNLATGNSGIQFVNLKFTSTGTTGSVALITMTQTARTLFLNCWFSISTSRGVSLITGSTGSSCSNIHFERCQFDVNSASAVGIYMSDIQGVKITDCTFNVSGTSAIAVQYVANGATSNMERLSISDCDFNHTSGTTQYGIFLAGSGTTGGTQVQVHDNEFTGALTNVSFIDLSTLTAAEVCSNTIVATAVTNAAIRLLAATNFIVDDNVVKLTQASAAGIGILIGATARSGSASACTSYSCSTNNVTSSATCYAFGHPGSGSMRANIIGNRAYGTATVGEYEIWNLGANPTTYTFDSSIVGNMAAGGSGSAPGWACYTGVGATRGGRAGNANGSNLIFTNNNAVGTVFGTTTTDDFLLTNVPGGPTWYVNDNNSIT